MFVVRLSKFFDFGTLVFYDSVHGFDNIFEEDFHLVNLKFDENIY